MQCGVRPRDVRRGQVQSYIISSRMNISIFAESKNRLANTLHLSQTDPMHLPFIIWHLILAREAHFFPAHFPLPVKRGRHRSVYTYLNEVQLE
jgi:hypothetical protein